MPKHECNPVKTMNSVAALDLMMRARRFMCKVSNLRVEDRDMMGELAEQIRLHRNALERVIGEEKL